MNRCHVGIIVFFLVIVAVNAELLYLAVSTRTDLLESSPYEKGMNFQTTIDGEAVAREVGLSPKIKFGPTDKNGDRVVTVSLTTRDGAPFTGAKVSIECLRPNDKSFDIGSELTEEPKSLGVYTAVVRMPVRGLWLVSLNIEGQGKKMQVRNRQEMLE